MPESAALHPCPLRGYHEETKHTKDAKKKSASSFVIFVPIVLFVPASAATRWQRNGERPGDLLERESVTP